MADTLDVATLDEAKDMLLVSAVTTYDDTLPGWITAASRRLDKLIGPVVRRTITGEKHNGGVQRIFLQRFPNTSITNVTEYAGTTATVLTAETNALKPSDSYIVDDYSADATYLSNIVYRRSGGADATFPVGRKNVEFTYAAGRFADTASVGEDFKKAVGLMLMNLWRSQQDGVGQVGEFDVPQSIFPTFAVPNSVRQMFDGEIQDPGFL